VVIKSARFLQALSTTPRQGLLTSLLLENYQITSIPSDAFHFSAATDIKQNFGGTKISTFPTGFFHHFSAEFAIIHLNYMPILTIPSFYYPSASYVDIHLNSNSEITSIPSGVFNFPTARQI